MNYVLKFYNVVLYTIKSIIITRIALVLKHTLYHVHYLCYFVEREFCGSNSFLDTK
jgi:hypothetical protein